ncbi:MAG: sigma-70 family RNA polymerase sigma factor [Acidobacteriota bacterium]
MTHHTSHPTPAPEVTRLLLEWRKGDDDALERLTPVVYGELRRLARHHMRGERRDHVLQTTALVHEAYLKLVGLELEFRDRVHFFAMAARLMRRVLVDFARERWAEKRGGDAVVLSLEEDLVTAGAGGPSPDVLALDSALEQLAGKDPRKARVVELRFFGGLTIEETAEAMEISHATVERDLKMAKAWLSRRLGAGAP